MKRTLALMMFFSLLIGLCSCSLENGNFQEKQINTSSESEKYWQASIESLYPMGVKGQTEAVAVCNECVFAAGKENNMLSLVRMEFGYQNNRPEFGFPQLMPVPEKLLKAQILGMSCNTQKLYILLGEPREDGSPYLNLQVWIYETDGQLETSLTIDFPEEDFPIGILALPNELFCIVGSTNYAEYDSDGNVTMSLKNYGNDFCAAMLLGENVVVQSTDLQTGSSLLYLVDREAHNFTPIENTEEYGCTVSVCQGQGSTAMINNGAYLLTIGENFESQIALDWYKTIGDYGYDYSYICKLNENCFLLISKDTGELKCLNLKQVKDERMPIRIGLYGHASDIEDQIYRSLSEVSPEYRIELVNYGSDDVGLTRLVSELGGDSAPELIISEGYLINPSAGFADLYTFIEKDEELSRDSFLPFILQGLERNGELPQIWGCFGLYSAIATGVLAESPDPLRLVDAQNYLKNIGYSEPLFDEYFTRETLLSNIANSIIYSAWNAESESYNFEKENIRKLIELCTSLPKEYDFDMAEPPMTSQVLAWRDISLEYLNYLESEKMPFKFFTDTEDNMAQVAAYYNSCYMIPERCVDKEKVWGFLRELLKEEYQTEACANGYHGFPTNARAYAAVVKAYLSEESAEELNSIVEKANFSGYESFQIKKIFTETMYSYLYGNTQIDEAISKAQSRINIFAAEVAN